MSDLNTVELVGTLAVDPEVKRFDSGTELARLLVTVRMDHPRRRVDVVPVSVWEPTADLHTMRKGARVSIIGTLQRRYWDQADGRRSRMEVVAHEVAWFSDDGIEEFSSDEIAADVAEDRELSDTEVDARAEMRILEGD